MSRPIVTLTTDFGDADGYVGTMKGVILAIAARYGVEPELVDLAHQVAPGDIRQAAMLLAAAAPYFPDRTVHLVVVDPGVGTDRAALAIATPRACFVGPDNGVLTLAAARSPDRDVYRLESEAHRLDPVSGTFHGRDVFAPAAAHLACGTTPSSLGPPHPSPIELALPKPLVEPGRISATVVYVDRFGNLVTNVPSATLAALARGPVSVTIGKAKISDISKTYGARVERGAGPGPVALINSWGWLEIAWPNDSAAKQLQVGSGAAVILEETGAAPGKT